MNKPSIKFVQKYDNILTNKCTSGGGGKHLLNKGKKLKLTTLGFKLIELLAVIVILAIIAIIATPIVLNIIKDSKENAIKTSIDGIIRTAITESALKIKEEEILYKYEENKWSTNKLNIDGEVPKYVEIKINKEGKTRYAITDGNYCAIKEYDSELNIKKISNKNNEKEVQEQYCKLDAVIGTTQDCFEFDSSTGTITKYYTHEKNDTSKPKCPTEVVIPQTINGTKVISIGNNAFYIKSLTSVEIPEGVEKIGNHAFYGNKLTSVTIPGSVENMGDYVFENNRTLKTVKISEGVQTISRWAFNNCSLLEEVLIPSTITQIGGAAFSGAQIKELDLSKCTNLTEIGGLAFANNKLESIKLPQNQAITMSGAFNSNLLSEEEAYIYKHTVNGIDYSEIVSYAGSLKDITIPSEKNGVKLTSISHSAFSGVGLTSVEIPEGVTKIRQYAFNANKLTSIVIPGSIKEMGYASFDGNSSLVSIINKTGKSFNWSSVLGISETCTFTTGVCNKVTITDN